MKKGIIPIIFVVFLTAVISLISTPNVIAKPDKTKSLSEKATKLKVSKYEHEANILLCEGRIGDKSKYKEAIKKCEKAIKLNPNNADTYLLLGVIYSSMGQYDKADSTFDKAATMKSDLLDLVKRSTRLAAYLSKIAPELTVQKRVERAKQANANLRKMSPQERQEYEEKMKKISSENLSRIKKEDRKERESQLIDEGRILLDADKFDKAIKKLKEVIKINPNNASAYFVLGIAYSDKEDYNKANEAWDKAISMDPKLNSNVSNMKKINQRHQSMTPEEKLAYQKRQKDLKAWESLPAEERERVENERKAKWDCSDGRFALANGWHYKNNKKYDEAITNFKKALELKPDYEDARLGLGDAYYLQKLYNQAMEEYKKVIAKNPKSINAHFGLQRCYVRLKKFEEAKTECNIVLKIDPNNIKAKEYLIKLQSNKSGVRP